jgi:hypothetical protein
LPSKTVLNDKTCLSFFVLGVFRRDF